MIGPQFDDKIMREALSNIKDRWDDTPYCLVGGNCQHFADALRYEYSRLTNSLGSNESFEFDFVGP